MRASLVLADASALVALLDRDDGGHERTVEALADIESELVTVWPALTEAMHLLGDTRKGQRALVNMIEDGAMRLAELGPEDLPRMNELMDKYANLPMDFADAALVRAAERHGFTRILTLDRHFNVYRLPRRARFTVMPTTR